MGTGQTGGGGGYPSPPYISIFSVDRGQFRKKGGYPPSPCINFIERLTRGTPPAPPRYVNLSIKLTWGGGGTPPFVPILVNLEKKLK